MVRVKICGITRHSDAVSCVEAGASALGFVFAPSPRRVSPVQARRIIQLLPPWVAATGVFVNEPASRVLHTAKRCGLHAVQLHGDEDGRTVRLLQKSGLCVIKAFRVAAEKDLKIARESRADAVLLDTAVQGMYGGSGQSFDWRMLKNFRCRKPVIVSGGLNPKNVTVLLAAFQPYAVDVSSGVEKRPGVKDDGKVQEFVTKATIANEK